MKYYSIPEYDEFHINTDGDIIDSNGIFMQPFIHNKHYYVKLKDDIIEVAKLVLITFIGILDPKLIIDHKNGKKWCCSVWNLEQISQYENVNRAYDLGLNYSRWSNAQINIICQLLERNNSLYEILDKIGLPKDNFKDMTMLIHMILNKKYYTEISKHYDLSNYMSELNKKDRKLSVDDVIDIKQHLHAKDIKIIDIAKKYDCTPSTITKIRDGKTWKHIRYEFNE